MRFLLLVTSVGIVLAQSDLLERANAAYRSQHMAEAVQLYREYLAHHGGRADVHVFLGAALLGLEQLPSALEEARQAIAIDPSLPRAYTLAGRVFAAQRQWETAQEYFSRAASLDPHDRETAYFSGRAYFEANRFEDSVRQFSKALDLGAKQSRVYRNLGLAWEALADDRKADDAYRLSVQLTDRDYQSLYTYGLFLFKQNRINESEATLREALQLQSNDTEVRFALARLLYHSKKYSQAAEVLEKAQGSKVCRVINLLIRIYSAQNVEQAVERTIGELKNCFQGSEEGFTSTGRL